MKVAVILGGSSEERDVSIASGLQVISGLRVGGHEVIAVDTGTGVLSTDAERALEGFQVLRKPPESTALMKAGSQSPMAIAGAPELQNVDLVFVALHGGTGEDGTFQALLEASGIPFTGSGHIGSALAMDKDVAKRLMVAVGVPTPAWEMRTSEDAGATTNLGYPVIVKPNAQGSTIGLSLVREAADLQSAICRAGAFDSEVMLEAFVPGREFTVGILDGRALAVGEIVAPSEIFDYESKYQQGGLAKSFRRTSRLRSLARFRSWARGFTKRSSSGATRV